mmetsp:Transcript_11714/g.28867  ORF Transcript_11714/g.28867 Transcript_11714/m.28867 type:complete len:395 (+) Transcript_11714:454-1638(+)
MEHRARDHLRGLHPQESAIEAHDEQVHPPAHLDGNGAGLRDLPLPGLRRRMADRGAPHGPHGRGGPVRSPGLPPLPLPRRGHGLAPKPAPGPQSCGRGRRRGGGVRASAESGGGRRQLRRGEEQRPGPGPGARQPPEDLRAYRGEVGRGSPRRGNRRPRVPDPRGRGRGRGQGRRSPPRPDAAGGRGRGRRGRHTLADAPHALALSQPAAVAEGRPRTQPQSQPQPPRPPKPAQPQSQPPCAPATATPPPGLDTSETERRGGRSWAGVGGGRKPHSRPSPRLAGAARTPVGRRARLLRPGPARAVRDDPLGRPQRLRVRNDDQVLPSLLQEQAWPEPDQGELDLCLPPRCDGHWLPGGAGPAPQDRPSPNLHSIWVHRGSGSGGDVAADTVQGL